MDAIQLRATDVAVTVPAARLAGCDGGCATVADEVLPDPQPVSRANVARKMIVDALKKFMPAFRISGISAGAVIGASYAQLCGTFLLVVAQ